ncbi:helix-turn-helix domain-containing protein [Bacteroides heparinolyticus]|uniref:helix-turn-helix domain-containing protein n=1 Tax=Prevotella heparinolytica TaxID=28113 RepID=UPI0035A03FF5
MISGQKLKKLRLLRELTQKELAIKAGLTDAAIRNYELGNRSPTKEQMQKIAQALDCDISALTDHESNSIHEFIHIIFDYEKEMKLRPLIDDANSALLSHDMNFNDFLVEWDEMRKKHYNGEITDEEFEDWKLSYPKKSRFLRRGR